MGRHREGKRGCQCSERGDTPSKKRKGKTNERAEGAGRLILAMWLCVIIQSHWGLPTYLAERQSTPYLQGASIPKEGSLPEQGDGPCSDSAPEGLEPLIPRHPCLPTLVWKSPSRGLTELGVMTDVVFMQGWLCPWTISPKIRHSILGSQVCAHIFLLPLLFHE